MTSYPRFISFVAVLLGCFDLIRGFVHTVLAGSTGVAISGIDVSGPTGLDQLTFMIAFGYSNFVTGIALIYLGLTHRLGALIMLGAIPVSLLLAGASLEVWGSGLQGLGVFPGKRNMQIYAAICVATVSAALLIRWRHSERPQRSDPGDD